MGRAGASAAGPGKAETGAAGAGTQTTALTSLAPRTAPRPSRGSLPVTAVAFPPTLVETPMAKVVADAGLRQLHVAETEKYAHVTYFLNGGHEQPFPKEDRVLVPSPKVATYDLQPEMSADGVADKTIDGIRAGYPFLALNFANPDAR